MKETNKELEYRFFNQKNEQTKPDTPDTMTLIKEINDKINALERKIDIIFDGHILINGAFQKINLSNKALNPTQTQAHLPQEGICDGAVG